MYLTELMSAVSLQSFAPGMCNLLCSMPFHRYAYVHPQLHFLTPLRQCQVLFSVLPSTADLAWIAA